MVLHLLDLIPTQKPDAVNKPLLKMDWSAMLMMLFNNRVGAVFKILAS